MTRLDTPADGTARRRRRRYTLLGALTAGVLALGGVAATAAPATASSSSASRFEVAFMTSTIDHHYLAIKMGELCLQKTTAPPPTSDTTIRTTCSNIITTQKREIKEMKTWLARWYGVHKQPSLPSGSSAFLQPLKAVHGETFDVTVSREFILHHAEPLPRAQACAQNAKHEQLKNLCSSMFSSQLAQIATFDSVLSNHGLAT